MGSFYNTYIAFSDDLTFDAGNLIAEAASVPEALIIDNDIYVYFVNAYEAHKGDGENIYYMVSKDGGETWVDREPIEIGGLPEGLEPVDPSLIELEDGQIRLYFYDFGMFGSPLKTEWIVYSAISDDGVHFEMEEGARIISDTNMTDPEVVIFEGMWLMFYAGGEENGIAVASSMDGLNFEDHGSISDPIFLGIPGAIVENEEVRIYGDNGYASSTDGVNFEVISGRYMSGFDPSPIEYRNKFIMIYKDFTQEEPPSN